jgi:tetratricopeptide (TPR) repeat protein
MLISFLGFAQKGSEYLIKANRATLEKNYELAESYYYKFIALNPKDYRGYFNLGTTQYSASKFDEAIVSFTTTLKYNKNYKEAYYYRGMCKAKQKEYLKAIEDYNKVLKKDSFNVPFLKQRAVSLKALHRFQEALDDLNQCIDLDRYNGDLYKERALLKAEMKDYDGAISDYNAVQKLLPAYKMVHYKKGELYVLLDDFEFACEEFELAIKNGIMVADRPYKKYCLKPTR